MKLSNPIQWWHRLPQTTRIRLIAGVLLVLFFTEAFVFAPWAFDVATLIDLLGVGFFDAFLLAPFILYASQTVTFLKSLWTRAATFPSLVAFTLRSSLALDRHVVLFHVRAFGWRGLQVLVWTVTVASSTACVVRAAQILSVFGDF